MKITYSQIYYSKSKKDIKNMRLILESDMSPAIFVNFTIH